MTPEMNTVCLGGLEMKEDIYLFQNCKISTEHKSFLKISQGIQGNKVTGILETNSL